MTTWTSSTINPPPDEIDRLISEIEASPVGTLHQVVKRHLRRDLDEDMLAFPRCEQHHDRYLYGLIHLPTSSDDDGATQFMELVYVATLDHIWTVLRHEGPATEGVSRFADRLRRASEGIEAFPTCGSLIGRFLTVTVAELEEFLAETDVQISAVLAEVDEIQDRHLSRHLKERVPDIRQAAGDVRQEVESITNVVDQLVHVVGEIVADRVDLRDPEDPARELFDTDTEIHLTDTLFRARRIQGLIADQLRQLGFVADTLKELSDADEVSSGRFMGAIASIMLFPTFIAGLYGMNFESMPELHWPMGYGFALGLIVIITVGQVWYFRRRRWL